MKLLTASFVLAAAATALFACRGTGGSPSHSSAASTLADGSAGALEGDACNTNDDCAGSSPLSCVADPDDGSTTCEPCATALPVLAALCNGNTSNIQFANDGTCGVQSCGGSDGGDDSAQCRLFEICPSGQVWDATQCGCESGSQGTADCRLFEECGRNKQWDESSCSCVDKPTCSDQGGSCVAHGKDNCQGSVIDGYCSSDGVCCQEFWGGN